MVKEYSLKEQLLFTGIFCLLMIGLTVTIGVVAAMLFLSPGPGQLISGFSCGIGITVLGIYLFSRCGMGELYEENVVLKGQG